MGMLLYTRLLTENLREYPSKILDFVSIVAHELASISEVDDDPFLVSPVSQRRIERLVNTNLSELPAFLVAKGGVNSGFMIAHCTAAALVSENKGKLFSS